MALFEALDDAVLYLDSGWTIVDANAAALALYGYSRQQLIGLAASALDAEVEHIGANKREDAAANQSCIGVRRTKRMRRRDGEVRDVEVITRSVNDPEGNLVGHFSIARDVTAENLSARLNAEAEARFRNLFELAPDGILLWDPETRRCIDSNPATQLLLGYSAQELADLDVMAIGKPIQPDGRLFRDYITQHVGELRAGTSVSGHCHCLTKDGAEIVCDTRITPFWSHGKMLVRCSLSDITRQLADQKTLHLIERVVAEVPVGLTVRDAATPGYPLVYANERYAKFLGLQPADLVGQKLEGDSREVIKTIKNFELVRKKGQPVRYAYWSTPPGAQKRFVEYSVTGVHGPKGEITHFVAMGIDRTVEQSAIERAEILSRAIDQTDQAICIRDVRDPARPIVYCNEAYAQLAGLPRDQIIGPGEPLPLAPSELHRRGEILNILRANKPFSLVVRTRRHDGVEMTIDHRTVPVTDNNGVVTHSIAVDNDITERLAHEARLRRDAVVLQNTTDAYVVIDTASTILDVNEAYCQLVGQPRHEVMGLKLSQLAARLESITAAADASKWLYLVSQKQIRTEQVICRPDGTKRVCEALITAILDEHGRIEGAVSLLKDVTEVRARDEQLRQAQKMEAIGNLTGGIAHDFNNLLAVMITNLELADRLMSGVSDTTRKLIRRTVSAAERGAKLVQRMLAFSRRQALKPERINADFLIHDLMDLLHRSLPASIEINHVRKSTLWDCEADRVQLESAILNVAINARDAMPDGGTLLLETDNVELTEDYTQQQPDVRPGPYIRIAMSDTGCGIAPDVLPRVFDPFFTTKSVGAGSGLGLSMVYGFVKQSAGHISIYSEVGDGTTVSIYLPRITSDVQPEAGQVSTTLPTSLHGRAKVLYVEDNDDLRAATAALLQTLDFDVLTAADGLSALQMIRSDADIDVLLTDVVLRGGMNGPALARQAGLIRPELRIVYASGYTENAIVHGGRLDPGITLLHKPFSRKMLAECLARILA